MCVGVRIGPIAHRNVQLIGGDETVAADIETPTRTDGRSAVTSIVSGGNCASSTAWITRAAARNSTTTIRIGNHRPCQFHLVAAVNLRRLAAIVVFAAAELDHCIDDKAENDEKDSGTDGQHEKREMIDGVGRRRSRAEDIGDRRIDTRTRARHTRPRAAGHSQGAACKRCGSTFETHGLSFFPLV